MARIDKAITVMAPIAQCYQMWVETENFPRFMAHVKSIRRTDNNRWHWVIEGPLGDVDFDVAIERMKPDQLISWHSVGETQVSNSGAIRFDNLGTNQTLIEVILEYHPPAGKLGEFVADIIKNPEKMIEEDLEHFKQLAEEEAAKVNTSTYPEGVLREDV